MMVAPYHDNHSSRQRSRSRRMVDELGSITQANDYAKEWK